MDTLPGGDRTPTEDTLPVRREDTATDTRSLHAKLQDELGTSTLKEVRQLENMVRKIARYKNHLHFTLRCKHQGLTPVSLKLKTSLKVPKAIEIVTKAEKDLLDLRVRDINYRLELFQDSRRDLRESLFSTTTMAGRPELYDQVMAFMDRVSRREYDQCRQCHMKNFNLLQDRKKDRTNRKGNNKARVGVDPKLVQQTKSRWVKNISLRPLSSLELLLLNRGLNFSVVPDRIPTNEVVARTEEACRFLAPDVAEEFRSDVVRSLSTQLTSILSPPI